MQAGKTRILYLGNKLLKHGFTPTSIETLGLLLAEKYEMHYASSARNQPLRLIHMVWSVVWHARKTDVIIIDTYSTVAFHYAWICGALARILGIPYVPILRGGDLPDRLKKSPRLCQRFFGHAHTNVVPSGFLMSHFENKFGNLLFLPNNIPLKNYRFKIRERVRPKLLYVRAFQEVYNPTMAVRVLAALTKKHGDVRLCMVGPDKDGTQADVEALAKELGVSDRLEITGRLSKPDWIAKSVDFDIFINTTNFDNHPVSVTEAMALGLPVVSTNAGGLPNLIDSGEEGLLVPIGDVGAMTAAIESLLDDPAVAVRMAARAREKVEGYDWDTLKKNWFQLLDGAAEGKRA